MEHPAHQMHWILIFCQLWVYLFGGRRRSMDRRWKKVDKNRKKRWKKWGCGYDNVNHINDKENEERIDLCRRQSRSCVDIQGAKLRDGAVCLGRMICMYFVKNETFKYIIFFSFWWMITFRTASFHYCSPSVLIFVSKLKILFSILMAAFCEFASSSPSFLINLLCFLST